MDRDQLTPVEAVECARETYGPKATQKEYFYGPNTAAEAVEAARECYGPNDIRIPTSAEAVPGERGGAVGFWVQAQVWVYADDGDRPWHAEQAVAAE
jgi:hypothetical protein